MTRGVSGPASGVCRTVPNTLVGRMTKGCAMDDGAGETQRVRRFFQMLENRSWGELERVLAPDVVYEMPQTRERITGRDVYLMFNESYPGDWHLKVNRVADSGGREAAVWVTLTVEGKAAQNAAFIRFDDAGLITSIVDFWPEEYEPPDHRPEGVERY
jgi:ketosteroid isomerase-like protein